jgi:hypothetical protein
MVNFVKKDIKSLEEDEFPSCEKCIYCHISKKDKGDIGDLFCKLNPPQLLLQNSHKYWSGLGVNLEDTLKKEYYKKYLDVSKDEVCGQGVWIFNKKYVNSYSEAINRLAVNQFNKKNG